MVNGVMLNSKWGNGQYQMGKWSIVNGIMVNSKWSNGE